MPNLSRRVILEDAYRTPDGAGGFTVEWQSLGALWAEIKPGRGAERLDVEQGRSIVPLQVTIRAAPVDSPARPNAGQRLREGGRIYRVDAVEESDPAGLFLTLRAVEETSP